MGKISVRELYDEVVVEVMECMKYKKDRHMYENILFLLLK